MARFLRLCCGILYPWQFIEYPKKKIKILNVFAKNIACKISLAYRINVILLFLVRNIFELCSFFWCVCHGIWFFLFILAHFAWWRKHANGGSMSIASNRIFCSCDLPFQKMFSTFKWTFQWTVDGVIVVVVFWRGSIRM